MPGGCRLSRRRRGWATLHFHPQQERSHSRKHRVHGSLWGGSADDPGERRAGTWQTCDSSMAYRSPFARRCGNIPPGRQNRVCRWQCLVRWRPRYVFRQCEPPGDGQHLATCLNFGSGSPTAEPRAAAHCARPRSNTRSCNRYTGQHPALSCRCDSAARWTDDCHRFSHF